MARVAVLLIAIAGCYSPSYRDCEITCTTTCPAGLTCRDNYCRIGNSQATCEAGDARMTDSPDGLDIDAPYPTGPWGTPTVVDLPPLTDRQDPALTGDLDEIFFRGNSDIYTSKRTGGSGAWLTAQAVPNISDPTFSEQHPNVSADGLTMYVSSDRTPTVGTNDIWLLTRVDRTSAWSLPQAQTVLDTTAHDSAASISGDGLYLVLASDINGTMDLFESTRSSTNGTWSTPSLMTMLSSTTVADGSPCVSPDKLTIYFYSARNGTSDLYVAHRMSMSSPFTILPISELDTTTGDETDPWVSPDGHHMFFTLQNPPGSPSVIYETSR